MSDLPPHLDAIDDLPRGHHEDLYFTYGDYQYLVSHERDDRWGFYVYRFVDWHEVARVEQLAEGSFDAAEFSGGAYRVQLTGHAHRHDAPGEPLTWRDALLSLTAVV